MASQSHPLSLRVSCTNPSTAMPTGPILRRTSKTLSTALDRRAISLGVTFSTDGIFTFGVRRGDPKSFMFATLHRTLYLNCDLPAYWASWECTIKERGL